MQARTFVQGRGVPMKRVVWLVLLAACRQEPVRTQPNPAEVSQAQDSTELAGTTTGDASALDTIPEDAATEIQPDAPVTPDTLPPQDVGTDAAVLPCVATTCDDGNACTEGDTCTGGACLPGPATTCQDDNPCTTDACDPASSCVFSPNDLPCDDGMACTSNDTCKSGSCTGTGPVWRLDLPQPEGTWTATDLAADAGGDGWLLLLTGHGKKNGKSMLVRVDSGGQVLWNQTTWVALQHIAGRAGGWSASTYADCATGECFESGMFVYLYDAGGNQIGWHETGWSHIQLPAVTGSDVWVARDLWKGSPDTHVLLFRHLDAEGSLLGDTEVPSKVDLNKGTLLRAGDGTWIVAGPGLTVATPDLQFQRLDANLVVLQAWTAPMPLPSNQFGALEGLSIVSEVSPWVVAGTQSVYPPPEKSRPMLAMLDKKSGWFGWTLQLPWPQVDPSGWQSVRAVRMGDGEFEVTAVGQAGLHTASWRLRADGTLRWRKTEDDARHPVGAPMFAVGQGVVTLAQLNVQGVTVVRLVHSDAFGNVDCASSGPCYDLKAGACDDADPCTTDRCDSLHGGCWHEMLPEGATCGPGAVCKAGACGFP